MAPTTNRKLQTEIERCLKRVSEGRAEFEDLWQKVQSIEVTKTVRREEMQTPQYSHPSSKDQNLREKLMGELKRELKKLQERSQSPMLRDLIRTWALLPDMRDPEPLHCARRDIEHDMERFKVCERERKTKAFSKVGLTLEDKLDPSEVALQETADWLRSAVTRLEEQIEAFEADLEALSGGEGRRSGVELPQCVEELEVLILRHRQHIIRMEQVLRLLENDQVSPEEVETVLRDGIEYYIESALEPDFEQSDADLYEPLPLEHVDETIGKLITKHERPAEASEDESPPPMRAKTVRMSKSAKKAAARAAAQAEAAAIAKREAAAPIAATVSGPSTPVLAITIGGSMRTSSEITAGSLQGTQPETPGSGRSMTSGNSWAERFILATPTALTLPPCAVEAPEAAAPPVIAAPLLPIIAQLTVAEAAAVSSPVCVEFLSALRLYDGSHDQQQPEYSAGDSAEPFTQLMLPPGLHLSGEEQRRVRAETAATAALQRPGCTSSRKDAQAQLPRQAMHVPMGQPSPAVPGSPPPASPSALAEVVLSPTMWPAINAVASATPTARLNRVNKTAPRWLSEELSQDKASEIPSELLPDPLPSPESCAAAAIAAGIPPLQENGRAHSVSILHTPMHATTAVDDLSEGIPMTPIHPALSLPIVQPPKPPPPTPAFEDGGASGEQEDKALMHAASNHSRKSKVALAEVGGTVYGGSCPTSPNRGVRPRRTSLPASPLTSPQAGCFQNGGNLALRQHQPPPPPPSARQDHAIDDIEYESVQVAQDSAFMHPNLRELRCGAEAISEHPAMGPPPDSDHWALQLRAAPSPAVLRQLSAAAQSRPSPADSRWPGRPGSASGSWPAASVAPAPANSLAPSWPCQGDPLPPVLRSEATMRRMSRETLFFAFHFQQGTARQIWAARELKAQGCRYHKKLGAWFSRASEPRVLAPTYEQGTFLYFDYHLHGREGAAQPQSPDGAAYNGWCMRSSRSDFVFEYGQMEDEVAF